MRIITLEEHYTDDSIIRANQAYTKPAKPLTPKEQEAQEYLRSRQLIGEKLTEFSDRLRFMDEQGITMQVLSLTSPVSDQVPAAEAVRICRQANDLTARHIAEHPDRFAGFATLPMADPEAAADELERAVRELRLSGALLAGRYRGRFYNEAEFFPIFERAAALDVPIYFHPALVPQEVLNAYYLSDNYPVAAGLELSSAGYGWHVDTGIQVMRLILSGIFDKLPNLKIISGHWGETNPICLERMDTVITPEITGLKEKISTYYKEHVYLTPSGILSQDQLNFMVQLMGADHILYAIDYPYMAPTSSGSFLEESDLSAEDKEKIAHKNAERLLHLKPADA